jgi:hypothetical protein
MQRYIPTESMSSFHTVYYLFFDILVLLDDRPVIFQNWYIQFRHKNQQICIIKKSLKLDQQYEYKELEKDLFNP